MLQCWFNLSDEGVETAIYDSYAMRKFMGIHFLEEQAPDATTLLHLRRLMKESKIGEQLFRAIHYGIEQSGYGMRTAALSIRLVPVNWRRHVYRVNGERGTACRVCHYQCCLDKGNSLIQRKAQLWIFMEMGTVCNDFIIDFLRMLKNSSSKPRFLSKVWTLAYLNPFRD